MAEGTSVKSEFGTMSLASALGLDQVSMSETLCSTDPLACPNQERARLGTEINGFDVALATKQHRRLSCPVAAELVRSDPAAKSNFAASCCG